MECTNTLASSSFFNQSFYQQLVSNVVAGLVTGIVVGVIILLAQRAIESRRERLKVKNEIAAKWEEILTAAGEPDTLIMGDPRNTAPPSALAISNTIRELPIPYWYEVYPGSASLKRLADFNQAYRQFIVEAAQFSSVLNMVVRTYNASRGAIQPNDSPLVSYYVGKLFGLSDDQISPFLDFAASNSLPEWITSGFNELEQNATLKAEATGYAQAKKKLATAINRIRNHPAFEI